MRYALASCASLAATASVALVVLAGAGSAHRGAPVWSLPVLMSRLDGARVVIGAWSRRVQPATTLCSGTGRGRMWGGQRHWRHFVCTWTVFEGGGVGRDVAFRVHTVSPRRFVITSAHFGTS
jgi:hypothetical protein